jgi:AcrR family transcriptional regulator
MPRNKREELVETALDLFMREGFHATGIDRILAEAGVAKMTLYHHFRSKDELILAALRLRDERFRNEFMRLVEKSGDDPAARLHAIFDVLGEMFDAKTSRGCTFINACAEYGDRDSAIHCIAAEHKRLVVAFVEELAVAAGARDPVELACQLCLLMDGVAVTAQVSGDESAAARARAAAELLVAAQRYPLAARPVKAQRNLVAAQPLKTWRHLVAARAPGGGSSGL